MPGEVDFCGAVGLGDSIRPHHERSKGLFRYYFVNSATGEKSAVMFADAKYIVVPGS